MRGKHLFFFEEWGELLLRFPELDYIFGSTHYNKALTTAIAKRLSKLPDRVDVNFGDFVNLIYETLEDCAVFEIRSAWVTEIFR